MYIMYKISRKYKVESRSRMGDQNMVITTQHHRITKAKQKSIKTEVISFHSCLIWSHVLSPSLEQIPKLI